MCAEYSARREIPPQLRRADADMLTAFEQHPQLQQHTHAASDIGGDGRAFDSMAGIGPQPKISNGSSAMLRRFATISTRMAIAASPAPRNTALITNNSMITTLPPSIHWVAITVLDTPFIRAHQRQQFLRIKNAGQGKRQ